MSKDKIISYLKETYHPLSILLYGSYVDGTQDEYSDFDCMVIVEDKQRKHDDTVIDGVTLDCYIFTKDEVEGKDIIPFITAYDAEIVLDDGCGAQLEKRVRQYVAEHSAMEEEEKKLIAEWIRKSIRRAQKNDEEGAHRAVMILFESLCDYCFLRDKFYFGSKKTVKMLKETDEKGYLLYREAILTRTIPSISAWAEYVVEPIGA